MVQELEGLAFLKKNQIKDKICDTNRPFAFISYSHDPYDTLIVRNVFTRLYDSNYNLWIDTANMLNDENSWKASARLAVRNKNCVTALFFRSESSCVKETIKSELNMIKLLDHIKRIIVVDIWKNKDTTADSFYRDLLNNGSSDSDVEIYDEICDIVSRKCNAVRLSADAENDIVTLVKELQDVLESAGLTAERGPVSQAAAPASPAGTACADSTESAAESSPVSESGHTYEKADASSYAQNEFVFSVFGDVFRAKKLNDVMYGTFEAIKEKYPERIESMAVGTAVKSVARKEAVDSKSIFWNLDIFRVKREYSVGGNTYYVGTSYDRDAAIAQAKRMVAEICGDKSQFVLLQEPPVESRSKQTAAEQAPETEQTPLAEQISAVEAISPADSVAPVNTCTEAALEGDRLVYSVFGDTYSANGIGDLMHGVFDAAAKKYPEKIPEIAATPKVSCVALKETVDQKRLPWSGMYFRAKRTHEVDGTLYYVGTSYDRTGALKQVKRMVVISCGDETQFALLSAPPIERRK